MGKWILDRFELLYFDLKHKRWRLFQEDLLSQRHAKARSLEDGELVNYRRYIQDFLHSIHAAFKQRPEGSEIIINPPKPSDNTTIIVNKDTLGRLEAAFREYKPAKEPKEVLNSILKYYQDVIRFERLHKDEKVREAKGVANLFDEFLQEVIKVNFAQDIKLEGYSYTAVLDAISILPILRHWDVWGALDQGRAGNQDSLLHEAGRIREPMYAAKLTYREEGCDHNALSTQLLGYEVRLHAVYQDTANPSAIPQVVAENDYFAYCYNPLRGSDGEKPLYLAYGSLLDKLQKASTIEEKQENSGPLPIYYIACPIVTTFGRRHFLHFYLRPDDSNATATLQDLWDTWKRFQALIGWENLRPLLISEMEHIDLAYFQTFLAHEIPKTDQKSLISKFCETGHLMFPIAGMKHSGEVFRYEKYQVPYEINEGNYVYGDILFECGEVWRPQVESHDPLTSDKVTLSDLNITYWPEESGGNSAKVTGTLNKGRRERTIRQQYDLAHQMWYAHRKQQENFEKMKDDLRSQCRRKLEKLPFSEKSALRRKLARADWQEIIVDGVKARDFLKPWLKSDEPLGDKHRHILLTILSGGVHLFLSEYLELHPIKRLCHTNKTETGYGSAEYELWGHWKNLCTCKTRLEELKKELEIVKSCRVYSNQKREGNNYCDTLHEFTSRVMDFLNNPGKEDTVPFDVDNLRKQYLRQPLSFLDVGTDPYDFDIVGDYKPYVCLPKTFLSNIGILLKENIKSDIGEVFHFRLPIGFESDDSIKNPFGSFLFRNYALIAVPSLWNTRDRVPGWLTQLQTKTVSLLGDVGCLYFGHRRNGQDWEYFLATEQQLSPAERNTVWPNEDVSGRLKVDKKYDSVIIAERKGYLRAHIETILAHITSLKANGLIILTFDGWYTYD